MSLRHVCRNILVVAACVLPTILAGCFKNPGQVQTPVIATAVPIDPQYKQVTNSTLWAHGSCNGSLEMSFTYSSNLTPTSTIEVPCVNGSVSTYLPIKMGTSDQVFTVAMSGRVHEKLSNPVDVTVDYTPAPAAVPGFAITVGGGNATDGVNVSVNSTIGDILTPTLQSGTNISSSTGLQGVLNDY